MFKKIAPTVKLVPNPYNNSEKVLEFTYAGKFTFKLTRVKAKIVKSCMALIDDFLAASENGDWSRVERHFPSGTHIATSGSGVSYAPSGPSAPNPATPSVRQKGGFPPPPTPGTRGPATVIKGSFAEVERRVGMGGVEIHPEGIKPPPAEKKEHIPVVETTDTTVTFR